MTTRDLFRAARSLEYDREQIFNHSIAFGNVAKNGFDETALGVATTQFTLQNEAELSNVASKVAQPLDSTELQVIIVNVGENVKNINEISKQIQEAAKANGVSSYVMGIVGRPGSENAKRNLKTTKLATTTSGPAGPKGDNSGIQNYLFPNTLSGILIMLFIVVVMIIGFLNLMSVQTPYYLPMETKEDKGYVPSNKMDFGKIEK